MAQQSTLGKVGAPKDITNTSISFHLMQKASGTWQKESTIDRITINKGRVSLGLDGGFTAPSPKITETGISWETEKNFIVRKADLKIFRERVLFIKGFLEVSVDTEGEKFKKIEVLGIPFRPLTYNLEIASKSLPREAGARFNLAAVKWTTAGKLVLSQTVAEDQGPGFSVNYGGYLLTDQSSWHFPQAPERVDAQRGAPDVFPYESRLTINNIEIATEEETFTGTLTVFLNTFTSDPTRDAILKISDGAMAGCEYVVRVEKERGANQGGVPFPELLIEDLRLYYPPLTIEELQKIMPDTEMVKSVQGKMVRNMKWAMANHPEYSPWLQQLFGEGAPTMTGQEIEAAKKDKDWYCNPFAKLVLTNMIHTYDGNNASKIKLNQKQQEKIKHFSSHGFSKSSSYHRQQSLLLREAMIEKNSRLALYVAEGNWAKRYLNSLFTSNRLAMLINRLKAAPVNDLSTAMAPVYNIYTLLSVLEPDRECANLFFSLVSSAYTSAYIGEANFSVDDKQLDDILRAVLPALIEELQAGRVEGLGNAMANEQTRNAMAAMLDQMNNTIDVITKTIARFGTKGVAFTELNKALFHNFSERRIWGFKLDTVATRKVKGFIAVALSAAAMLNLLAKGQSIDLSKMSAEDKIHLAAQCVLTVSATVEIGMFMRATYKANPVYSFNGMKALGRINADIARREMVELATRGGHRTAVAQRMANTFKGELQQLRAVKAGFAAEQRATGLRFLMQEGKLVAFLRVAGVLAAGVFAAFSIKEAFGEWTGDATTDRKITATAAAAIDTMLVVVAVAEIATAAAWVPVVGFVLVAAAIGLAIYRAFQSEEKPTEAFMRKIGLPFADGLPEPAAATA